MSKCPESGMLRAYADGECAGSEEDLMRRHMESCLACRTKMAELESAALFARNRFAALAPGPDDRSRLQVSTVLAAGRSVSPSRTAILVGKVMTMSNLFASGKGRAAFAGIAAVLLLAVALSFQPVRLAAEEFLSVFRVERFQPVTVDPNERMEGMMDLSRLGQVETANASMEVTELDSLDEARALDSLRVKTPAYLPPGVSGEPEVQMTSGGSMKFTFDLEKANAYLAEIGETEFTVPEKFDGAGFTVNVPPVLSVVYGGAAGEAADGMQVPAVMLMEANSPVVETFGGVDMAELREFLLSVPGLPPSLEAQLRAIDDWSNTLPVPIPVGTDVADKVTVNGQPGLLVADDTVKGAGVVWQEGGSIYFVGGSLSQEEVMKIANSMQ